MKITGIIVEYNPLHNGHIYHIQKTKEVTNCDFLIAVMSGNFVQRGEPAILDKWSRTEAALNAGVDMVLELPYIFSTSSAEGFAFGAISLLDKLKVVNYLCFGSELGDIEPLEKIADILLDEPDDYKNLIKKYLKSGLPFARARENALNEFITNNRIKIDIQDIMKNSNNILGVEYIKALKKLKSNIKPFTIQRIKNKYNEINITSSIASATAIRHNFDQEALIKSAVPDFTFNIIQREKSLGKCPVALDSFNDILLYKIRTSSIKYLQSIHDVSEGLEYKIKRAAEDYSEIDVMINAIISKRYTKTRIQRIMLNILLDITKDIYISEISSPKYARVLGLSKNGRSILKDIKDLIEIPLITNVSKKEKDLLKLDINASNLYVLAFKNENYRKAMIDLKMSPIILK